MVKSKIILFCAEGVLALIIDMLNSDVRIITIILLAIIAFATYIIPSGWADNIVSFIFRKKIKKGKKITVKKGAIILTVELTTRIDHGDDVSYFVSVSVKNISKKLIKNVKLNVSCNVDLFEREVLVTDLNPSEVQKIASSDTIHINKKTGEIQTLLTQIQADKVLGFTCEFSAESIASKKVIFAVSSDEDIYLNKEAVLAKMSRY